MKRDEPKLIPFFLSMNSRLLVNKIIPFAALSGVLFLGWFVTPEQLSGIKLCLFKLVTSYDCPGCGLTRSFLEMARLHVTKAFHYNWAGPLVYAAFLVAWVDRLFSLLKAGVSFGFSSLWTKIYGVIILVLLFSHWGYVLAVRINSD